MDSEEEAEYDQSLQDSLDQLDEDQGGEHGDHIDQQQQEEGDQGNEEPEIDQDYGKPQEEEERRDHYAEYLQPDQDVESVPPFVVVVQGSKQSGKSSIIRSLIKHYTRYKVDQIHGSITLRSNKKQRITLIECPNDLCAMIDLSKVADIVLLAIDASLGFEMQTFEFLSLLRSHGFPNLMGVLTHIDYFRENKQLAKAKKRFKKRFEFEVGGNNKLFPLSNWQRGVYPKIEVAKLARYIGTAKPPGFPWRLNHPYVIADRWLTVEDRDYAQDDRMDVAFHGYVRGSSYRVNGKIHVLGLGDYNIKSMEVLADPCPEYKREDKKAEQIEEESEEGQIEQGNGLKEEIKKKRTKRRTLNQAERIIYAPSCNLGALGFDHNSGYVTIPHDYVKFTRLEGEGDAEAEEGVRIVRNLQDIKETLNSKLRKREDDFELFQGVKINQELLQTNPTDSDRKLFALKQTEIRAIRRETDGLELLNPHEVHRETDLSYLIYDSKEHMNTQDCSKYHPQGRYSQDIKNLFVTGMGTDVLEQMAVKPMKQVKKAAISQATNFFQKGLYVKIVLEGVAHSAFVAMSESSKSVILTRVNLGQDSQSFLKVRFKRHPWYTNLLKSTDPVIISSGWRRYQSVVVFATEDANNRLRYLKYTSQHDFCYAVFYGHFNLQNSGCVFTQTVRNDLKKFRIAGTGLVLQINKSFQVMKKIKLVGEPFKVMKNTAFVKGMFNSSMEVANYLGAQIRTVSGVRGQIKKAIREGGDGTFRATFQDKILMSDLVFCRAWYKVILQRFCNPLHSFLSNHLMKTKYQLRMEHNLTIENNPDSNYKVIDRAPKRFAPFMVPKKLEAKLPFKSVEKVKESRREMIKKREAESIPKLLSSDKQREVAALIQRLNTIKHIKEEKKEEKLKEKKRIVAARQAPKLEYYAKMKKAQKSQKMASVMRKKRSSDSHRMIEDD